MNQTTAPLAWGWGDTYTLLIAVLVFVLACFYHRRAIRARGADGTDLLGGLMSISLSIGPLLMIVLDPLNKYLGVLPDDLLRLVVNESRLTLWFACFLALVNTTLALLRPRT